MSFSLTIAEVQHWLAYSAPSFPGSRFIPAILGTIVFVHGGLVFTGESKPVSKVPGATVIAGTVAAGGSLRGGRPFSSLLTLTHWGTVVIAISTSLGAQNGLLIKDKAGA